MSVITPRSHSRIDIVGMLLSAVCMLHCLLLPIIVIAGVGGDFLWSGERDWTHQVMLGLVVPISGIALIGGWMRHKRPRVAALGVAGIVILTYSALIAHDQLGHTADALLTTLGGGMLALAHWRNRDCGCAHEPAVTAP